MQVIMAWLIIMIFRVLLVAVLPAVSVSMIASVLATSHPIAIYR